MRVSISINKRLPAEGARNGINLVLFQLGWFACVLLEPWLALLVTGMVLIVHHRLVVSQPREWLFVAALALTGVCVDAVLSSAGILSFPDADFLVPAWLWCLWLLFATTLNHALTWLRYRLVLAAGLGAVFGPASYFAGAQLNAASLGEPVAASLAILAGCWLLLLPLALIASRNLLEGSHARE